MIERRKYPRFELKVDAAYKVVKASEVSKVSVTRNISAEGLCFSSGEKLHIGSHVMLEVDLKDNMPPVALFGEIRWCEEIKAHGTKEKSFANGVKLINMPQSDESRFLKYYCDRMVDKLSGYLKM